MKIGFDFGTAYSKIAYLDSDSRLKMFRYPVANGREYIPTAMAYRSATEALPASLGEKARLDALTPEVQFCENFKLLLPYDQPSAWAQRGWIAPQSPTQAAHDYFDLLLRKARDSFEHQHGPITNLVVSVPEIWQQRTNPGAEVLRRLLVDELQLPVDHLRSEPVCAAAYFVYAYQKLERRERPFNLLVCDMGGGTFDVALCHVRGSQIEVLDFDGNGNAASGDLDSQLGLAGVAFDRAAVELAWRAQNGQPVDWSRPETLELLRNFESVKIAEDPEVLLLLLDPNMPFQRVADTPLYRLARGFRLTLPQVQQAFAPITTGIQAVLGRLQTRAQAHNWPIDRVAIVGGFGQYPLVERVILETLNIPEDDARFDRTLNSEGRFYAVAYGAALIANDMIQPVEKFPHTVGLDIHIIVDGRLEQRFLSIVEANQLHAGQAAPHFARRDDGELVVVKVEHQAHRPLPVRLRLRGVGDPLELRTSETDYPPPGNYHVGVLIDRSNLGSLVFRNTGTGEIRNYNLGDMAIHMITNEGSSA